MDHPSEGKLLIGAHTSIAGGVHHALYEGREIGATTVQIFTANQKQWKGKPLTEEAISLWHQALEETGLTQIMSHASYLINLGSPNKELVEKSKQAFKEEINRCQALQIAYLNFHPGAATTGTTEQCLDQICTSLKTFEKIVVNSPTRLLLETTAGQGSNVGFKFEHLAYIVNEVKDIVPIGVCIDTCHIFAAGYDIRTQETWENTLEEFDHIIGLEHLYAFHLNDSAKPLGSRRDRHAHLGNGDIGLEAFRFVMQHPRLSTLPKYLETPKDLPIWEREITQLRQFAHENNHQIHK